MTCHFIHLNLKVFSIFLLWMAAAAAAVTLVPTPGSRKMGTFFFLTGMFSYPYLSNGIRKPPQQARSMDVSASTASYRRNRPRLSSDMNSAWRLSRAQANTSAADTDRILF